MWEFLGPFAKNREWLCVNPTPFSGWRRGSHRASRDALLAPLRYGLRLVSNSKTIAMIRITPNFLFAISACLCFSSLSNETVAQSGIVARGPMVLDSQWGTESFAEIAADRWHTLARRDDGTVVAWGENSNGECNVPALPSGATYLQIAAGGNTICPFDCIYLGLSAALRSDGEVLVWGDDNYGVQSVPALPTGVTYVQVDAGSHVVAVRSDGELEAWGDNAQGQCDVPALPPGLTYVQTAAGLLHTLALRSDGSVVAWGLNASGQCDVPSPPPGVNFVEVSAGSRISAGRLSDGTILTWGAVGDAPALPAGLAYDGVDAGFSYLIARRSDGTAVGWGTNVHGQADVPPPPPGLSYVEMDPTWFHSFGRLSDGSLVSWGMVDLWPWGDRGQLNVPRLPDGIRYVELAEGGGFSPFSSHHTLLLLTDGSIQALGYNYNGACDVPALPPGTSYVEIGAGWDFSVARRSDGRVVRWGLSYGSFQGALPAGVTFVEIASGLQHFLARRSDGVVRGGGGNYWGQASVPALPPGLAYVELAAGNNHSMARRSDGSVIAWGLNDSGQCDIPSPPFGLAFVEIAGGGSHSLGRLSDGSVVAWGHNLQGQCDVPTLPPGLSYIEIGAGDRHSVARRSDGKTITWGDVSESHADLPELSAGRSYVEIDAGSNQSLGITAATDDVMPGMFCHGDGSALQCPCGNNGASGRGCENSALTGGAVLTSSGNASLADDQVVLSVSGEPPGALSIFFQGERAVTPTLFGDGLLCVGGSLKRMYVTHATSGSVSAPLPGDPSISLRSAFLGDGITPGSTRYYQSFYRDPEPTFCPSPEGAGWNTSSGLALPWSR